jgi:hypothetical protein
MAKKDIIVEETVGEEVTPTVENDLNPPIEDLPNPAVLPATEEVINIPYRRGKT